MKIALSETVISDDTGKVILNLVQQDSVALRVVARYAFQVGKPATRVAAANAYPFATVQTSVTARAEGTRKTAAVKT